MTLEEQTIGILLYAWEQIAASLAGTLLGVSAKRASEVELIIAGILEAVQSGRQSSGKGYIMKKRHVIPRAEVQNVLHNTLTQVKKQEKS